MQQEILQLGNSTSYQRFSSYGSKANEKMLLKPCYIVTKCMKSLKTKAVKM